MGIKRPDAEAFAEGAQYFRNILVDTSSLIVLADIGALEAAARLWHLATISEAAEEAGPEFRDRLGLIERQQGSAPNLTGSTAEPRIRIVPVAPAVPAASAAPAAQGPLKKPSSTDQKLVETAKFHRWPVLAEDRKILIAAEEAGLYCFDSLLAIELLKAMSTNGLKAYPGWHRKITERNTYTPYRLSWAEQVATALQKLM